MSCWCSMSSVAGAWHRCTKWPARSSDSRRAANKLWPGAVAMTSAHIIWPPTPTKCCCIRWVWQCLKALVAIAIITRTRWIGLAFRPMSFALAPTRVSASPISPMRHRRRRSKPTLICTTTCGQPTPAQWKKPVNCLLVPLTRVLRRSRSASLPSMATRPGSHLKASLSMA